MQESAHSRYVQKPNPPQQLQQPCHQHNLNLEGSEQVSTTFTLKENSNFFRNRLEFEHSFHEIRDIMKNSKASSTIKNYDYYYQKFQNWCNLHNFSSLPASTATVAIYLNSLVQRSVSVSVLYSNYYSIKWYHDLNLHSNPCDDKLISMFLKGGKRTLSKPIIKKDPITPDILNKIIDMYGKDHSNLKTVSVCFLLKM